MGYSEARVKHRAPSDFSSIRFEMSRPYKDCSARRASMASSALPRAIFDRMRLVMMNIGILYSGVSVNVTLVVVRVGHGTPLLDLSSDRYRLLHQIIGPEYFFIGPKAVRMAFKEDKPGNLETKIPCAKRTDHVGAGLAPGHGSANVPPRTGYASHAVEREFSGAIRGPLASAPENSAQRTSA